MKKLMLSARLLTLALLLFACLPTFAQVETTPVTIEWQWPENRCDGSLIFLDQIDQAEVYIDDEPIAAGWEASGDPCSPAGVPPDLENVQSVTTPVAEPSVTVDLPRGATYFFRVRVQVNGVWSNLSVQGETELEFAQPNIPVIVSIG